MNANGGLVLGCGSLFSINCDYNRQEVMNLQIMNVKVITPSRSVHSQVLFKIYVEKRIREIVSS